MARRSTAMNALIGAVATVLLVFLPFSPVLGGAVAGYLQRGDLAEGAKVGGLSGLIASIPALLLGFLFVSFFTIVPAGTDAWQTFAVGGLVFLLLAFAAIAAYTVGLSALGGAIGVYLEAELGGDRPTSRPR